MGEAMPELRMPYTKEVISWCWSREEVDKLIAHAERGHRLWELLEIRGQVDMVRYLYADISAGAEYLNLPEQGRNRLLERRHFSLSEFRAFLPSMEAKHALEVELVDDALLLEVGNQWCRILDLQAAIKASNDPLIVYELSCIEQGWTKFDKALWQTSGAVPLIPCHELAPIEPQRSQAFLEIVEGLIKLNEIESVTALDFDDFDLIARLSREWLRRKADGKELIGYSTGVGSWSRRDVDTYDNWETGLRYDIPVQPIWSNWFRMSDEGIGRADLELNLQPAYHAETVSQRMHAKVIVSDMAWGGEPLPPNVLWSMQTDSLFVAVTERGQACLNQVKAIVGFVLDR
jgi:hypothetical protein